MKLYLTFLLLFAISLAKAQDKIPVGKMKTYYMVFLKRNPSRPQLDSASVQKIQDAHLAYLTRMGAEGKLDLAGPFMDDIEIRGIAVYNTETQEEAERLANEDPAVKAGRLVVECHPWYAMKGATLK